MCFSEDGALVASELHGAMFRWRGRADPELSWLEVWSRFRSCRRRSDCQRKMQNPSGPARSSLSGSLAAALQPDHVSPLQSCTRLVSRQPTEAKAGGRTVRCEPVEICAAATCRDSGVGRRSPCCALVTETRLETCECAGEAVLEWPSLTVWSRHRLQTYVSTRRGARTGLETQGRGRVPRARLQRRSKGQP